jgi:hypothetical protein
MIDEKVIDSIVIKIYQHIVAKEEESIKIAVFTDITDVNKICGLFSLLDVTHRLEKIFDILIDIYIICSSREGAFQKVDLNKINSKQDNDYLATVNERIRYLDTNYIHINSLNLVMKLFGKKRKTPFTVQAKKTVKDRTYYQDINYVDGGNYYQLYKNKYANKIDILALNKNNDLKSEVEFLMAKDKLNNISQNLLYDWIEENNSCSYPDNIMQLKNLLECLGEPGKWVFVANGPYKVVMDIIKQCDKIEEKLLFIIGASFLLDNNNTQLGFEENYYADREATMSVIDFCNKKDIPFIGVPKDLVTKKYDINKLGNIKKDYFEQYYMLWQLGNDINLSNSNHCSATLICVKHILIEAYRKLKGIKKRNNNIICNKKQIEEVVVNGIYTVIFKKYDPNKLSIHLVEKFTKINEINDTVNESVKEHYNTYKSIL